MLRGLPLCHPGRDLAGKGQFGLAMCLRITGDRDLRRPDEKSLTAPGDAGKRSAARHSTRRGLRAETRTVEDLATLRETSNLNT